MSDTVDIEIENDEEEMADDIEAEGVDPGVAAEMDDDEEQSEDAFEGERAVSFETATGTLAETFDVDARKGETITDLSTVETDDGQQLVATVEHRRRTALSARLADARRVGRRVGVVALLGGIAALALSARRRSGDEDDAEGLEVTDTTDDEFDAQ